MEEKDISNRDVAILLLPIGFFEMIAKYSEGCVGKRKSQQYFKKGLQMVFPDLPRREQSFMRSLYSDVRCGLFHVGRPGSNDISQRVAPGSIGYNDEHKMIMISPPILHEDITIFFEKFSEELRNPEKVELRSNFERTFDHDNRSELRSA